MGDGWENARRRDSGNDHVTVRLAARGSVRRIEIDTSYFIGNSAGWASVRGIDATAADLDDDAAWVELVPKTRLQPDTRHFFGAATPAPVTHVRLDVFPDGGLARLRIERRDRPGHPGQAGREYHDPACPTCTGERSPPPTCSVGVGTCTRARQPRLGLPRRSVRAVFLRAVRSVWVGRDRFQLLGRLVALSTGAGAAAALLAKACHAPATGASGDVSA